MIRASAIISPNQLILPAWKKFDPLKPLRMVLPIVRIQNAHLGMIRYRL